MRKTQGQIYILNHFTLFQYSLEKMSILFIEKDNYKVTLILSIMKINMKINAKK